MLPTAWKLRTGIPERVKDSAFAESARQTRRHPPSAQWFTAHAAVAGAVLFLAFPTLGRGAEKQVLRGHIPAAVAGLASVGRLPAGQRLNLAIGLPLRSRESLTNLLDQLYDPASPLYHQFLTPTQFAERFEIGRAHV